MELRGYIGIPWLVFVAVWGVAALSAKRNERVQRSRSQIIHSCLIIGAFALLFWKRFNIGMLAWRFVPDSEVLVAAGLAITSIGVGIAIWARFFLGRNWSGVVTIKQDHRLVRRGPYAFVRHPIYSGLIFAMLGTALVIGEMRCLVGIAMALIHWWTKSQMEERFLIDQFGDEYVQYRREVKALIPFLL